VDTFGDVAVRDETPGSAGGLERGGREGWRRNSEEERGHERMNPIRKGRGTVGAGSHVEPETVSDEALRVT
jgi:hypothetical protein